MESQERRIAEEYLEVVRTRFLDMKETAEKAIEKLPDEALFWSINEESNSIAVIMKHMSGNMISRWTDIFETDGEKPDRNRDQEFVDDMENRETLLKCWEEGWHIFLTTLHTLSESDLLQHIRIRQEPHTVIQAIERQMYHYSYHIGQIVYIAKQFQSDKWTTLTIPRKH
ncbi:DinB family protein [Caldalkalibacillus salinus]|uniref:DinB family protein n=1 Tax=Caldalkalibacillus salinus TaxID=2803787 RepID=UPI0023511BE1|nr:DinB family protein [Caldalkalibacillus salinus]